MRSQRRPDSKPKQLVRSNGERETRKIRERLVIVGVRLGRIAHTRAGMRPVETWEKGHAVASKQLSEAMTALIHAETARGHQERCQEKIDKKDGSSPKSQSDPDADQEIGGIDATTKFDAVEAAEPVRFHIANSRQEEKELALQERRLKFRENSPYSIAEESREPRSFSISLSPQSE